MACIIEIFLVLSIAKEAREKLLMQGSGNSKCAKVSYYGFYVSMVLLGFIAKGDLFTDIAITLEFHSCGFNKLFTASTVILFSSTLYSWYKFI